MIKVYILTRCADINNLWASTMIFKTLRTGFPTAKVYVYDNCSCDEARKEIEAAARESSCDFAGLTEPIEESDFLRETISKESGQVVFLDTDIYFWDNCEEYTAEALVSGRYIPEYIDDIYNAIMYSRLHSSFLWIKDAKKLNEKISKLNETYPDLDPFNSYRIADNDLWYQYDIAARLYSVLDKDNFSSFDSDMLSKYESLYMGAKFFLLEQKDHFSKSELYGLIEEWHDLYKEEPEQIKGMQSAQDNYFKYTSPKNEAVKVMLYRIRGRHDLAKIQQEIDDSNARANASRDRIMNTITKLRDTYGKDK